MHSLYETFVTFLVIRYIFIFRFFVSLLVLLFLALSDQVNDKACIHFHMHDSTFFLCSYLSSISFYCLNTAFDLFAFSNRCWLSLKLSFFSFFFIFSIVNNVIVIYAWSHNIFLTGNNDLKYRTNFHTIWYTLCV